MDCRVCHGRKSRFLCVSCVSEIVLRHDKVTRKQHAQLAQVAAAALKSLDRDRRALSARREFLDSEIRRVNAAVQQNNDTILKHRLIVSERRTRLAHRKQNLAAAQKKFIHTESPQTHTKSFLPFVNLSSSSPIPQTIIARQRLSSFRQNAEPAYLSIAQLRRRLIIDVLDIFCIYPSSQASNPSSSPSSSSSFYSVVSSVLTTPNNPEQYSPAHLDSAVSHLAHCVRLIALYLGIKLPFSIFTGPRPSIRATQDSPWAARWSSKHPLCLLSLDSTENGSTNTGNSAIHALAQTKSFSGLASIATGQYSDNRRGNTYNNNNNNNQYLVHARQFQQFIIGLFMLAYNVSYIVHTQSPHHPASFLGRVPHIIANLRALVDDITDSDATFGRRSHTTVSKLPALEVTTVGNNNNSNSNGNDNSSSSGSSSNNNSNIGTSVPTNDRRKSTASSSSVDESISTTTGDLRQLTWNEVGFDRVLATALGSKTLWPKTEGRSGNKESTEDDWDVIDGQDLLAAPKQYSSRAPQQ